MAMPDIKSRSQRIQLDYFKRPDPLNRWRWNLVIMAAVLAGGYGAYAALWGARAHVSTGPLSMAHAHFEQSCNECHGQNWAISIDADSWRPAREQSLTQIENACQRCHTVANHFRPLLNDVGLALDRNCARCHQEHQGRQQQLTLVPDASCVDCHQDLTARVVQPDALQLRTKIERFDAKSHGDFRSLSEDTGRVHFDHFQHLQPGQVDPGKRGAFRLDMLPTRWRSAYRRPGQTADALVTLTCDDCHRLPTATNLASVNADDELYARHYLPIRYSQHCVACHSLNYEGQTDDVLPLPHAAPWPEIETLLSAKMSGARQQGVVHSPIISNANALTLRAERATTGNDRAKLERAVQYVRQQCLQCHLKDDISDDTIQRMQSQPGEEFIPTRWFKYGNFDHAAHRAMQCNHCHQLPEDDTSSQPDEKTVMIRGIDSCVPCHRDPRSAAVPPAVSTKGPLGNQPTWASDQCIECHRYHWTRESKTGTLQKAEELR